MPSEPSLTPSSPQPIHLNVTPIRVSTILFAVGAFLAPLAFFIGAFNDTGDRQVSLMAIIVLVASFILTIYHVITVVAITSPHIKLNGLIKATFVSHIILGACIALLGVCIAIIMLISAQAAASPTSELSDTALSLLIGSMQAGLTVALLILPAIAIAAVVLAFMLVAKQPALPSAKTSTPSVPPTTI